MKPSAKRKSRAPSLWRPVAVLGLALGMALLIYLESGRDGPSWGGIDGVWRGARHALGGSRFEALTDGDRARLAHQRELVNGLARRHVGTSLSGRSLDDLRVLQQIIDRDVLQPEQTYELQSLGVALGDVMAAQLGLNWVVLDDEFGRSRALRLAQTDVVIFPVTMISKRVEHGVPFRIDELYRKTARSVEKARSERARSGA